MYETKLLALHTGLVSILVTTKEKGKKGEKKKKNKSFFSNKVNGITWVWRSGLSEPARGNSCQYLRGNGEMAGYVG